ncbi:hypothetical protein F4677DRAFT_423927 [Hypoxylon crocopeplum]|nr:hypothetical protein F4677DRAFT_423927 [Hypoxylon crocopeplum]
MGKNGSKSSGRSSKKTKRSNQTSRDESTRSEMSPLERYVHECQRNEQIATGQSFERPATEQKLQDWDQTWQTASGR